MHASTNNVFAHKCHLTLPILDVFKSMVWQEIETIEDTNHGLKELSELLKQFSLEAELSLPEMEKLGYTKVQPPSIPPHRAFICGPILGIHPATSAPVEVASNVIS